MSRTPSPRLVDKNFLKNIINRMIRCGIKIYFKNYSLRSIEISDLKHCLSSRKKT